MIYQSKTLFYCAIGLCALVLAACVREQPQVIVITATFPSAPQIVVPGDTAIPGRLPTQPPVSPIALSPVPNNLPAPTLNPVSAEEVEIPSEHVVRSGDTLFEIASQYNVSLDALLTTNNLTNPDLLSVGQVLILPDTPTEQSITFKIMPDSRLVRAPGSRDFDIAAFIDIQPGYIRQVTDIVPIRIASGGTVDRNLNATQIIQQVSLEYSLDARLLLALLEYTAGWLSNPSPPDDLKVYPLISAADSGGIDRSGMYKQLAWAGNQLNAGYYNWKYRGLRTISFEDGQRLTFAAGLNPATIALQYFFSLNENFQVWLQKVDASGFYSSYFAYFGNPFETPIATPINANLQQPELTLPFASGEVWYYTGGHHGGWGSGSAWSSLDFAPPDERTDSTPFCFTSEFAVRAVAPGVIARSGDGAVILDLDGDGDESTGWTILYLHLAEENRIAINTQVFTGDILGYAACSGGFSTATHLHIARRFNGEWLPADCETCVPGQPVPPFVMSDWRVVGIDGQEYQGYLTGPGERRQAEQGRNTTVNRVSW